MYRIVVVGGGAGGLELVTKLGRSLGKKKKAEIVLVDAKLIHVWKPLMHEIAAGTLDSHENDIEYISHARRNHYTFRLGRVANIDIVNKKLTLKGVHDQSGQEIVGGRSVWYDSLVLAVGSKTNDFGIPGVQENCFFLDSLDQAERFRRYMLKMFYSVQSQDKPIEDGQLNIAIAGAGATGVELSAELHTAVQQMIYYGLKNIDSEKDARITLIEGGPNILPALGDRIVAAATDALQRLNINIVTNELITEATADAFITKSGKVINSTIKVWAAGVKSADFLARVDGLEINRNNQVMVEKTLQSTSHPDIFAIGDCAACPLNEVDGVLQYVPPRAQAAHQQASLVYKTLQNRVTGKDTPMKEYRYKDYGSLVNISTEQTVGTLMGNLMGKMKSNVFIEGLIARIVYISLFKSHMAVVTSPVQVFFQSISNLFSGRRRERIKLH